MPYMWALLASIRNNAHTAYICLLNYLPACLPPCLFVCSSAGADSASDEPLFSSPHLLRHLGAVEEVLAVSHECMAKWTAKPDSKLKGLVDFIMSKQYQDEFIDLNNRLTETRDDLLAAVRIMEVREERREVHELC